MQLLDPGGFGPDSCDIAPQRNARNGSGISGVKSMNYIWKRHSFVVKNIFYVF